MALVECKECKKEFSEQLDNCPNCGADILSSVPRLGFIGQIIFGSILIVVFSFFYGGFTNYTILLGFTIGFFPTSYINKHNTGLTKFLVISTYLVGSSYLIYINRANFF